MILALAICIFFLLLGSRAGQSVVQKKEAALNITGLALSSALIANLVSVCVPHDGRFMELHLQHKGPKNNLCLMNQYAPHSCRPSIEQV